MACSRGHLNTFFCGLYSAAVTPPHPSHFGCFVLSSSTLKLSTSETNSLSGCAITPATCRILCLRLIYLARPPGLRHRSKTRYGWVANPYSTGTCTPQDASSFARRDNDSAQPRLTATGRSGSEGSELSSVGSSALLGDCGRTLRNMTFCIKNPRTACLAPQLFHAAVRQDYPRRRATHPLALRP